MPESLCNFFRRNSDGTWTATKQVMITNTQGGITLTAGLGPGSTVGPGAVLAGIAIVPYIERFCR